MAPDSTFTYHVPTRLHFGPDALEHLAEEMAGCGSRMLLVYGSPRLKSTELYRKIQDAAKKAGVELFEAGGVEPNPRHTTLNRVAGIARGPSTACH